MHEKILEQLEGREFTVTVGSHGWVTAEAVGGIGYIVDLIDQLVFAHAFERLKEKRGSAQAGAAAGSGRRST